MICSKKDKSLCRKAYFTRTGRPSESNQEKNIESTRRSNHPGAGRERRVCLEADKPLFHRSHHLGISKMVGPVDTQY